MRSDGAVQLDLTANTRKFEAQANASAAKVSRQIGAAGSKLTASCNSMLGSIGKLTAGLGVAIAGAGLTKFSMDCAQAAANAQATANRVNAVFPQMAESVNAFASEAMTKMGMTGGTAKGLTARFGMMAQGMGYTEKASAGMAEQMTKLAGDMAAFYGITTDEAASKLAGVFTGMTRGFKQLGITMSEANLQAHALSIGMQGEVSSMNEAQLAALRLSYAKSQLSKVDGYAQRNLNTYNGQVQLLQQRFAAFKATIGKGIAAAMMPMIHGLNAIMQAALGAANAINALIERVTGRKLSDYLGGASGVVADLGDELDGATESTGNLSAEQDAAAEAAERQQQAQEKLNRALAGFDKINRLASENSQTAPTVASPSVNPSGVLGGLGSMSQAFEDFADSANAAVARIELPEVIVDAFTRLKEAVDGFVQVMRGGMDWVWNNILKPLGEWTMNELAPRAIDLVANAFKVLSGILDALYPVWDALFQSVIKPVAAFLGDALCVALDLASAALGVLADIIRDYVKPAMEVLGEFISKTFGPAFEWLSGVLSGALKDAVQWLSDRFDAMSPYAETLATAVGETLADAFDWLGDRAEELWPHIEDVAEWVGDKLGAAFTWLGEKIDAIWPWLDENLPKAFDALGTAADWLWKNVLEPFGTFLGDVFAGKNEVANAAVGVLGGAFEALSTAAKWLWENVLEPFGGFLADVFAGKCEPVNVVIGALGTAFGAVADAAKWLWDNILAPFGNFLGDVFAGKFEPVNVALDAFSTAWDNIKKAAGFVYDNILKPLGDLFEKTILAALNGINEGLKTFLEWLGLIPPEKDTKLTVTNQANAGDIRNGFENTVRRNWPDSRTTKLGTFVDETEAKIRQKYEEVTNPWKPKTASMMLNAATSVSDVTNWYNERAPLWKNKTAQFSVNGDKTPTSTVSSKNKTYAGLWKDKAAQFSVKPNVTKESTVTSWSNAYKSRFTDKAAQFSVKPNVTKEKTVSDWSNSYKSRFTDKTARYTVNAWGTKESTVSTWSKAYQNRFTDKTAFYNVNAWGTKESTVTSWNNAYKNRFTDKTAFYDVNAWVTKEGTVSSWSNAYKSRFTDKTAFYTVNSSSTSTQSIMNNWNAYKSYWQDYTCTFGVTTQVSNGQRAAATLRGYAQGGYVKRNTPQLAVIGDNTREGEFIAPESKMQSMLNAAAGGVDMSGVIVMLSQLLDAVKSQDTNVYLDGRDISRNVVGYINRQTQETGRCPVIV